MYPHPHDCTKFLQCSNGATYIQDCGPGTAFDSVRLLCDYKHKAKCCSSCTGSTESVTESTIYATESIREFFFYFLIGFLNLKFLMLECLWFYYKILLLFYHLYFYHIRDFINIITKV